MHIDARPRAAVLVHDWQIDKMASLGRAVRGTRARVEQSGVGRARGAHARRDARAGGGRRARAGRGELGEREIAVIDTMRSGGAFPHATGIFSAIERADHEEEVVDWLEAHGADPATAQAVAENGVRLRLDDLADAVSDAALDAALRWVAAGVHDSAAPRTSSAPPREFTISSGRSSGSRTWTRDGARAGQHRAGDLRHYRGARVEGQSEVRVGSHGRSERPPDGRAYGGEFNQVWSNLIENALDALP